MSDGLRIAVVGGCPYPAPQGSQVFLRDTAQCLQARGHEVRLVVYGYGTGIDYSGLRIHRAARVPLVRKTEPGPSLAKPLQDVTLAMALRRVLRDYDTQAVCAHNYEALAAALAARARPLIYFPHNVLEDELPYYWKGSQLAARVGRRLDEWLPRRADRVIAPHRRLAGHLVIRGCDMNRVEIVPPPLDAEVFNPEPVRTDTLPPVLYTGNLDSYQNLPLLQKAMQRLRRQRPEAQLLIATAMRAAYPEAEIVPVYNLDALQRLLNRDAVVAVPRVSWSGYPIKLLNAMAAGKAVVACESAAYPLVHEENGLIVPDNDTAAFASALQRLLEQPALRASLGARARQTILRKHRPDLVAARLDEIVRDVVGR